MNEFTSNHITTYDCELKVNPDGSMTLTGEQERSTFHCNGVEIILTKGASITISNITFDPVNWSICDSVDMLSLGDQMIGLKINSKNIDEFLNGRFEPEFEPKKLTANTFQHRKGAFANGGRG